MLSCTTSSAIVDTSNRWWNVLAALCTQSILCKFPDDVRPIHIFFWSSSQFAHRRRHAMPTMIYLQPMRAILGMKLHHESGRSLSLVEFAPDAKLISQQQFCRVLQSFNAYAQCSCGFLYHDNDISFASTNNAPYACGYRMRCGLAWAKTEKGRSFIWQSHFECVNKPH